MKPGMPTLSLDEQTLGLFGDDHMVGRRVPKRTGLPYGAQLVRSEGGQTTIMKGTGISKKTWVRGCGV